MAKKRGARRIILNTILSIIFILVGIVSCKRVLFYAYEYTLGIIENEAAREATSAITEMKLHITSDTTLEEISETLYKNAFISNPFYFRLEAKIGGTADSFNPGDYSISSNMSSAQILTLLTSDITNEEETVKLIIPEGFSIVQIAERLEALKLVSKEAFIAAVNTREYDYDFLKDIPADTKYKLEGYLFPDTYIIRKDATPEEIIIMMLNNFENVISEYSSYVSGSSYNLNQILSIASIVEEEAKLSEERSIIAGVIYNRLEADMKIQMCSTIQYILEKRKTALSYADLEVDSPYNTYQNPGLPVGPICSPGEDSIRAALMPETHDYYYFVVKDTEIGSHSFSSTGAEHEQAKLRYKQSIDKNFYE